jgi:hypothetical protein
MFIKVLTKAGILEGWHVKWIQPQLTFTTILGLAADIGTAYLNARIREKIFIVVCGKEFGDEYVGRKAVIVRALYGY